MPTFPNDDHKSPEEQAAMDARLSIVIDSNCPYYTKFDDKTLADAVYMTGQDSLFGDVLSVVYRAPDGPHTKLSAVMLGSQGTSGFLNMTLNPLSRFFPACNNLAIPHRSSLVRQSLAITNLRSFATMDRSIKMMLASQAEHQQWDETTAGELASKMKLVEGKYPDEMGKIIQESGVVSPKQINTSLVDVVYVDSDTTIEQNNELVYLLGEQLEQLFDPLAEYSPEPAETLYSPPQLSRERLANESEEVQSICEELFILQENFREELLAFLQTFLIPLRVKVLSNEYPGLTIRTVNTIFPPTIDEIVRVNNLLYEALQQSVIYGSFEMLKACGMTIPYFYKACMRHEAATRNFARNIKAHSQYIKPVLAESNYTSQRIESIIHCSLHLTRIKLILERLVTHFKDDGTERMDLINDYFQAAAGTIDAFGRESVVTPYDRRVFTPTGKVLVELAQQWPKDLEYGWVNRRVVTIFDAADILRGPENVNLHHIIILFTDHIVILEPIKPIPSVSASGVHIPSVADILTHCLINEAPLPNIPDLKVVAWAPIQNVELAEFNDSKSLAIYSTIPGGMHTPGDGASDSTFVRLYKLLRPDTAASNIVSLFAKAKVMNKTQPFHLFKCVGPRLSLYATVHELQGYAQEVHKTPIAVFLNVNVTRDILEANNLTACFRVELIEGGSFVSVKTFTRLGPSYELDIVVPRNQFSRLINSETAYLYTLHLSTKNLAMVGPTVSANREVAKRLLDYATAPSARLTQPRTVSAQKSNNTLYRKHPIKPATSESTDSDPQQLQRKPSAIRKISPINLLNRLSGGGGDPVRRRSTFKLLRVRERSDPIIAPVLDLKRTSTSDASSIQESLCLDRQEQIEEEQQEGVELERSFQFPPRSSTGGDSDWNDRRQSVIGHREQESFDSGWETIGTVTSGGFSNALERNTELVGYDTFDSNNVSNSYDYGSHVDPSVDHQDDDDEETETELDNEFDSEDEQEQQDVEQWYENYAREEADAESLDSVPPEIDHNDTSYGDEEEDSYLERRVTTMFDHDAFAMPAGIEFVPPKGGGPSPEDYTPQPARIVDSDGHIDISDDFRYLAGLIGDDEGIDVRNNNNNTNNNVGPLARREDDQPQLYPDLRDASIVFLGSYVRAKDSAGSLPMVKMESTDDIAIKTEVVDPIVETEGLPQIKVEEESDMPTSLSTPSRHARHARGNSLALLVQGSPMLRYTSAKTLQLASFTVELDNLIDQEHYDGHMDSATELLTIKRTVLRQYERARNVIARGQVGQSHMQVVRQRETKDREEMMGLAYIAIGFESQRGQDQPWWNGVVRGILDMELNRRQKVAENLHLVSNWN